MIVEFLNYQFVEGESFMSLLLREKVVVIHISFCNWLYISYLLVYSSAGIKLDLEYQLVSA